MVRRSTPRGGWLPSCGSNHRLPTPDKHQHLLCA
jgi:hypothetical protein